MNIKSMQIALAMLLSLAACDDAKPCYTLAPNDDVVDLGTIKESNGAVEFSIKVLNDTDKEIYPYKSHVTCSCLKIAPGRDMVQPGGYFHMDMSYDPAYRSGQEEEKVYLAFNGARIMDFTVRANVVPMLHPMEEVCPYDLASGLHVNRDRLLFGHMAAGESKELEFKMGYSEGGRPEVSFTSDSEFFGCLEIDQPGKVKNDWRSTIKATFTMPDTVAVGDTIRFNLQPLLNGKAIDAAIPVAAYRKANN